jgi:hypothetical protein
MPTLEFPAAELFDDAVVAAVADAFMHPAYVYLLRVVDGVQDAKPNANMPTVEFPAAEPPPDAADAAVADELTHPEKVYLLRVVNPPPPQL